jgi:hypothetical protein
LLGGRERPSTGVGDLDDEKREIAAGRRNGCDVPMSSSAASPFLVFRAASRELVLRSPENWTIAVGHGRIRLWTN